MYLSRDRILPLLEERGMNQSDLGKKVGSSRFNISRYLNHQRNCPEKKIKQIADVLDVNYLDIIEFNKYY